MKKRTRVTKPESPLSPSIWIGLIQYLTSDYLSRPFVTKLSSFFSIVNTTIYEEDGDLSNYYEIVKRMIQLMLDERIYEPNTLIERIVASPKDGEDLYQTLNDIFEHEEDIDGNLAIFIENEIISRLNFITVGPMVTRLEETISRLRNDDFEQFSDIIGDLSANSNELQKTILAKSTAKISIPDISFTNKDLFTSVVDKTRKSINDEKRIVKTGLRALNKFLGGGWEPGRVYLANGISGGLTSGSR